MSYEKVYIRSWTLKDVVNLVDWLGMAEKNALPFTVPQMTHFKNDALTITVTSVGDNLFDVEIENQEAMDNATQKLADFITERLKNKK
jgi:hypothetical protein